MRFLQLYQYTEWQTICRWYLWGWKPVKPGTNQIELSLAHEFGARHQIVTFNQLKWFDFNLTNEVVREAIHLQGVGWGVCLQCHSLQDHKQLTDWTVALDNHIIVILYSIILEIDPSPLTLSFFHYNVQWQILMGIKIVSISIVS